MLCDAPAALATRIVRIVQSMILFPQVPATECHSEDDVIRRRDPRLCSALLQNPAFMNPFLKWMFSNAAAQPHTKLEWLTFAARGLFNLLLGRKSKDSGVLQFKPMHDWICGR